MEEPGFLLWSPWFSLLSYITQQLLPNNASAHNGLGLHTAVINQENASTDMPTRQINGGNSVIEILSSQLYLGLCQVHKN